MTEIPAQPVLNMESAAEPMKNTMDMLLSAGNVTAVYGAPVQQGEHIVIPAAEVLSIAGFGYGSGSGQPDEDTPPGSGSGGGGGGRVFSRPVAVVVVTDNQEVTVKPVLDVTKIALAWVTMVGFIFTMMSRMRRGKIE